MNTIQRGIIALMKSAVTRTPCSLPEDFDLEQAYPLIRKHHISPMAYDGACRCGFSRQMPIMQQLFMDYRSSLLKSEGQMRAVQKVMAAFDANGIDYMPLKGCKLKQLYPAQELRIMGDADILIRTEQYDKILPIMQSLGFREGQESDHELVWRNQELHLELHKRLIPSYNKDFYAYFGEGWQLAKCQSGTRYAMTQEDEMVYLFTHFAKHYRDGGIGYRYVTDLWVYRCAHPQMDEAYIRRALEQLQLAEFYDNVLRLITVWFADAPTDEKMDYMTDFIFASGSWGAVQSRVVSSAVKKKKNTAGFAKLQYALDALFPSVTVLRSKYTVLKKCPWLLPVVWLVRPFYKVIFEAKTLKWQKKNLDALTKDEIRQRRKMLNYVGLDYNF